MTRTVTAPENEFTSLAQAAAASGLDPRETPSVQRKWVNISTGGHVSGVAWRTGPARLVLLPRPGTEARYLDRVALLLPEPLVVIDLPGSGRSSGPAAVPSRAARSVAVAVQPFAPHARLIAGIGESAGTALAVAGRVSGLTTVAVVDAAPGEAPAAQFATVEWPALDGEPETTGAPGLAAALLDIVNRI